MARGRIRLGQSSLPKWAAAFVALSCVAILALAGWREWESRNVELHTAEVDMANLARSLTQHAEDSFELADTVLIGLVDRLETDGTGPPAIAKIHKFLQLRKAAGKRIRGIFVYDEHGRWLATTEQVNLASFNNSDRDYFQHHRTSAGPRHADRPAGQEPFRRTVDHHGIATIQSSGRKFCRRRADHHRCRLLLALL